MQAAAGSETITRMIADSPAGNAFPSEGALADLQSILGSDERLTRARIRKAVARICAEAHELGLRCEELVIQLKKSWSRIPDAGTYRVWSEKGGDGGDLLSRVVSEAIDEFYRMLAADGGEPDGTRS